MDPRLHVRRHRVRISSFWQRHAVVHAKSMVEGDFHVSSTPHEVRGQAKGDYCGILQSNPLREANDKLNEREKSDILLKEIVKLA